MVAYLLIIFIANVIVGLLNYFLRATDDTWYFYLLLSFGFTALEMTIDVLMAILFTWLPKSWFNHEKKIFQVSKKEMRFYDFLHIKAWKDHIPELGQFTNFRKNKVADPKNNEYLERFMYEAASGMCGHYAGALMGFLVMLADFTIYGATPQTYWLTIGLPVAIVNFFLCLGPAFALRYNMNRLEILWKSNKRREERALRKKETATEM